MVSQINSRVIPQRNVVRPLLQVWKNAIDSLTEDSRKEKVKVFPTSLRNRFEVANLALNHAANQTGPNPGLWNELNRQRLKLASQLAEQGIYV
jgi:hypothetical protein